jgi:DNA-binding NarL/FixJ family response regulator
MLALAFAAAVLADSVLLRSGLAAVLSASPELQVTHAIAPSESASLAADDLDVVVHDVRDEIPVEEALAELPAAVPVLALVGEPARTRELLRAGVQGVVHRDASSEVLTAASVAVANGLAALDRESLRALLVPATPADSGLLTARERQVLDLVADGYSNKLIAERLGTSEHTAKFHVRSLLDKLGADTRTEAVAQAVRRGLLAL